MICRSVLSAAALLALAGQSAAIPFFGSGDSGTPSRRSAAAACSLSPADSSWMQGQGIKTPANAASASSASAALSADGPFTMTFTNSASQDLIGLLWDMNAGYQSAFVKAQAALVAFSLAKSASCSVSVANNVSGAWSSIYGQNAQWASEWGFVSNSWGEFTTADTPASSVVDLSMEPAMKGHPQTISVSGQCTSDSTRCYFDCIDKSATHCGDPGTYALNNCVDGAGQQNTQVGTDDGNPTGGCGGWSITKHVDVDFLD